MESPAAMASEWELDDAHGWFTWLPPMAPRLPAGGQPSQGPDTDQWEEEHSAGPHPGCGGVCGRRECLPQHSASDSTPLISVRSGKCKSDLR